MKKKIFPARMTLSILIFIVLCTAAASCQIINVFVPNTESNENTKNIAEEKTTQEELEKDKTEHEEAAEEPPVKLLMDDSIPECLKDIVEQKLRRNPDFSKLIITDNRDDFDISMKIGFVDKDLNPSWLLVPAVSFFKCCDDISWADIKEFWDGNNDSLKYIASEDTQPELIITGDVFIVLEAVLGKCKNDNIKITAEEDLLSSIEYSECGFSIIPFDKIVPELKILNLDGVSVFDKDFNILQYPLTLSINITGPDPGLVEKLKGDLKDTLVANRDIEKLTTVIMTGVTAPAQGKTIGSRMNEYGAIYPAEKIADVLRNADITHISNEIPFVEGCSGERYLKTGDCVFCCRPEHIELLRYVGTDVVELTGNHMNDFGSEWMLYTLDMYDEEGWLYFGGGRNLEDSYKPALFEVNGNKIAFLGCNYFGPAHNWATEDTPGSARINMWDGVQMEEDFKRVESIVKGLKKEGYAVIFTFQYVETYNYFPTSQQVIDFRRITDAGADIVSGSQSHQPMGVEFRENGFITYGLGNLFFNQANELEKKQGIIAKHIFYEGRHINTVLITTMLEDLSQPRLATAEERLELLESIFDGSIR